MEARLLLVDDDPGVIEVLSEFFLGQGYYVETASGGEDALRAVRQRRPDLVLLDIRMEGLDGVEVLRRLRAHDERLPVIMVTASEDVKLAREMVDLGAFDYVAKPFDFDHLQEVVATALLHAPPGGHRAEHTLNCWTVLVGVVFHAVRGMTETARRSIGTRMEDAALSAARAAFTARPEVVQAHLAELSLLLAVAVDLGDLAIAGRDAIAEAARTAGERGAAPS